MFKKIVSLITALSLTLGLSGSVFANENVIIELLSGSVHTDYLKNQVTVKYSENLETNEYFAEIIDLNGNVLEVYSEQPEIPISEVKAINNSSKLARNSSTYNTNWSKEETIGSFQGNLVKAKVTVNVNITAGSYWRQVNYVNSCKHAASNSGYFTLEDKSTHVNNSTFPVGDKLSLTYDGVIQITKQNATSAGLTITILEGLNFDITTSSSSTWYARKPYEKMTSFQVWV